MPEPEPEVPSPPSPQGAAEPVPGPPAAASASSDQTAPPAREPLPAEPANASPPAPAPAPRRDVPLKRQWDAELDAELEKALEGFDASSYDAVGAVPSAAEARGAAQPRPGRSAEPRPGPQPGKVVAVRASGVFVDLGAKSEGVVPVEQFQGNLPAQGQTIEVIVDRFDTAEGLYVLALKGAAIEANWENVHKGVIVEARGIKVNKGGLEVDVDGIRGFMPISQIDINRVEDAAGWVGQRFRAIVTEADPHKRNLVVSRRELLEREREELREKTWSELAEGQVRPGVVRSVKSFGAFVDLGGVDGLLHVADMSWARVADVSQCVKVGQEVQVKVLKIDRQSSKINLGLKQLMPSPWDGIEHKYARGTTVHGKVTRCVEFGAFVELEPGVEGLVHVSELSPNRVRKVSDIVQPGQEVDVRVIKVEPEAHKISLSLRPAAGATAPTEEEQPEASPPPKPKRTVPLKGGLGDRDNVFDRNKPRRG